MINLLLNLSFGFTLISFIIYFFSFLQNFFNKKNMIFKSSLWQNLKIIFPKSSIILQISLLFTNIFLISILINNWILSKHIPISNLYGAMFYIIY